jgi:hypothetical protein
MEESGGNPSYVSNLVIGLGAVACAYYYMFSKPTEENNDANLNKTLDKVDLHVDEVNKQQNPPSRAETNLPSPDNEGPFFGKNTLNAKTYFNSRTITLPNYPSLPDVFTETKPNSNPNPIVRSIYSSDYSPAAKLFQSPTFDTVPENLREGYKKWNYLTWEQEQKQLNNL